jgi:hypothetical protein
MAQSTMQAKLCPHCANSVALDAVTCPYCKAELNTGPSHEWPDRTDKPVESKPILAPEKRSLKSAVLVVLALLVFAFGGYFVGSQQIRSGSAPESADRLSDLQEKDQKIQTLEADLAKLREGNQGSSSQVEELKAKLDEREKDLASAQRKLADANQEIDRLTSSRAASVARPPARSADAPPAAPLAAPTPARRAAEPGIYETVRSTSVYEEPAASSRVLTKIGRGTRVTVVRAVGEWLEVRSKHDNPPGFIRSDDAMFVARSN